MLVIWRAKGQISYRSSFGADGIGQLKKKKWSVHLGKLRIAPSAGAGNTRAPSSNSARYRQLLNPGGSRFATTGDSLRSRVSFKSGPHRTHADNTREMQIYSQREQQRRDWRGTCAIADRISCTIDQKKLTDLGIWEKAAPQRLNAFPTSTSICEQHCVRFYWLLLQALLGNSTFPVIRKLLWSTVRVWIAASCLRIKIAFSWSFEYCVRRCTVLFSCIQCVYYQELSLQNTRPGKQEEKSILGFYMPKPRSDDEARHSEALRINSDYSTVPVSRVSSCVLVCMGYSSF